MVRQFTSESVTEGHPDKIADGIADTILDSLIGQDPQAHVAVETLVSAGTVVVSGEVTTTGYADVSALVRDRIRSVGYDCAEQGWDGTSCGVLVALNGQSPDIAQGVGAAEESRIESSQDRRDSQGAGDQGLMFGYACTETASLMPLPIDMAHRLSERLTQVRKDGTLPYLRADGKTQVTIDYDGIKPVGVKAIVVSSQHKDNIDLETQLRPDIRRHVIAPVLERYGFAMNDDLSIYVNPTGRFVQGGPMADAGVTGRKIIVDSYGGMARHGGGAFSGKDPSKVDRSAAYGMRWIAKNVVAAGLAERCEVQVAYAIGRSNAVGFYVDTFGTGAVPDAQIEQAILEVFDTRPLGLVEDLDLLRPIYALTTCYGHFGRELPEFTWETTDRAEALARAVRG
ncbi:MAG: methionine adenosyltransferase [Propionibacteriaceae bacterium]